MAGTRFAPDRGLTLRMVATMFLLGLIYVLFVAALIALGVRALVVLAIAGGLLFVQYFFSDRIALFAMQGHEVSPQQAPELHAIVDRLAALAGIPKPRVAIADMDLPNAFATGRNQREAVVCVTTGLLRRLDASELEGVIAHELSHVAHRDVAVMTIASFLGVVAGLMTRFVMYTGFGGRRNGNGPPVGLIIFVVSGVVYTLSFLLTRALSRYRELAADRAGALLTQRPSALASALTKVSGEIARIPTEDLRAARPFSSFFFAPALSRQSVVTLLSTHPPLERRLEQLAQISRELGR
ncbi:protease HtpX [Thermobispora bispora]|uniref:Protease HtpX homolog n=1 Tax=Thermobispora bispora (strain ATCC 19993 / DSM 43833 / CBS 139.67 / JCM 10125 / KCTC 9307 / NBRC 14880 / R51) TaxID=469371 RepID=D6Y981_THEBD|nr:zinc metalloprotease HtpX [Thermobispora bispora]ADG88001.1 peptidase M48 Ste24p [Thermobispora bispora DSM 43833]MBO2474218.1 zinc metalloprotease HtpX [Actinomycetales bacterium]QSI47869.1 zinc metalloprotease HtpX [Thermobispora bispora]